MADLNLSLIERRLGEIRSSVNRLARLAKTPKEVFLSDPDTFAIAEHHLRLSLEAVLDVGRHIIAKKGLGETRDYRGIFVLLGRGGVLPQEFAARIQGMAGYRNRLVHGYAEVTAEEIYEVVTTGLRDFEEFVRYILDYVEQERASSS